MSRAFDDVAARHRESLLNLVRDIWGQYPDLRFCQLIGNAVGRYDPYYCRDEALEQDLRDTYGSVPTSADNQVDDPLARFRCVCGSMSWRVGSHDQMVHCTACGRDVPNRPAPTQSEATPHEYMAAAIDREEASDTPSVDLSDSERFVQLADLLKTMEVTQSPSANVIRWAVSKIADLASDTTSAAEQDFRQSLDAIAEPRAIDDGLSADYWLGVYESIAVRALARHPVTDKAGEDNA